MKQLAMSVSALIVSMALVSAPAMAGQKQTLGTILGAGAGGLLGSQVGSGKGQLVGVAVGTLLGAGLGNSVGKSLDAADQAAMSQTMNQGMESTPSGQTVAWKNPDSGHAGTYTPQPAYQTDNGQYCREFQQTIIIGGKEEKAFGTACRQPDGSWQTQN